jgi:mono/diheme cytochrome c family protein
VLARIDRVLAPLTLFAAVFAVTVLLIGPELIGARKSGAATTTRGAPRSGKEVFASAGCGGCHTLKAAGSTGTTGPNLDQLRPDQATVANIVKSGRGGMPSFNDRLSQADVQAVARYVATNAGR